jgi:dihydroorotate dehydrogenase (NAD+) catalytic subunit
MNDENDLTLPTNDGHRTLGFIVHRSSFLVGSYATAVPTDASLLRTTLAGIELRNPVLLAAGTAGLLDEMSGVLDLSRIGGVVTKSVTRHPREGNPTWRIVECRAGMLNAIGLANPGIDAFEEHVLPRAAAMPCVVIASVAGFSIDEYVEVAGRLDDWHDRGVKGVELNVSCPNVRTGTEFGASSAALRELMAAVRPEVAKAAIDGGADALTIGNTMPAMAIDVRTRRPRLANVTGGLSGPALHPIAVRLVHEVYTKAACGAPSGLEDSATSPAGGGAGRGGGGSVPVVGAGGVMTWEDAAEFVLAGATAVQMGTSLFADPRSPLKVVRGLEEWVRSQERASIGELVGAVLGCAGNAPEDRNVVR